jgi:HEAT repeat protein
MPTDEEIDAQVEALSAEDDDEARASAYEFFYSQLLQPGSGPAAAHAAPLLIGLAGKPETPQRAHLLELLEALSAVASPQGDVAARLREGADTFAALLKDEDPEVRLQATQLAARWHAEKDAACAALRALAEKDEDERVRANALLAMTSLGAPDRALAEALFRAAEERMLERLAGATALVSQLKNEAPAEVFEHLLAAATTGAEELEQAEVLPALGDPWGTVAAALWRAPESLRERALTGLTETYDARPWATDEQSAGLLHAALGGKAAPEALASLTPLQKEAIRAVAGKVASNPGSGVAMSIQAVMREYGLPTGAAELAALLGGSDEPASAGEAPAGEKKWWKLW